MYDLYGGVKDTQLLARQTKIEKFFSKNYYVSETQTIHRSELARELLTNEDMNTAFTLMVHRKIIKTGAANSYYLDMNVRYRPKIMVGVIIGCIALATLIVVICAIIAFSTR